MLFVDSGVLMDVYEPLKRACSLPWVVRGWQVGDGIVELNCKPCHPSQVPAALPFENPAAISKGQFHYFPALTECYLGQS